MPDFVIPAPNPLGTPHLLPLFLLIFYYWAPNLKNNFFRYTKSIIFWSKPYLNNLGHLNTLVYLSITAYIGHLVSQCRKTQTLSFYNEIAHPMSTHWGILYIELLSLVSAESSHCAESCRQTLNTCLGSIGLSSRYRLSCT